MKRSVITGLFLLLSVLGFSQGEFNIWYFGDHAGVNFASGPPIALNNCSPSFFCEHTTATVSDSLSNLLFYADFEHVFNRNHAIMANGSGLFSGAVDQPVLPVQKLDDDSS